MLRVRDASYRYDAGTAFEVAAVEELSLDVAPGGLTLVTGETGSGKTTLLRLLAGLATPTAGTVTVGGESPEPASDDPERRIGLLFQRAESQLFAETVEADIEFGPRNLGMDDEGARRAAHAALEAVGLSVDDFADRSPFTLSGGEARRVALAGVLAMAPRYLLLDEPTAGLDAVGRAAVRAAVGSAREQCGVVVVTHEVEELLDIADAVVVLDQGRLRFSGSVDEFIAAAGAPAGAVPVPATIRLQYVLREAGLGLDRIETDPRAAAHAIVEAGGLR